MVDDEILKKYNVNPPTVSATGSKEMLVIFKLASRLKPSVSFYFEILKATLLTRFRCKPFPWHITISYQG